MAHHKIHYRLALFACVVVALCVPAEMALARRIIALGDLHGDYNQSCAALRLTRLIDHNNYWIGEDAMLVQLGDVLDVGPDDIKIVRLLMQIGKEAEAKGGEVVMLLGNHELRNFRGDYNAADAVSLAECGGSVGRDHLLSNQTGLGMYLRTRKAIYRHGPFLFMHGGLSTATVKLLTHVKYVDAFNRELRNALVNGTISPLASGGLNLEEDDEVGNPILVRSILNVKCDDLIKVLDKRFAGIQSVVVGHVPHDPRDFTDWHMCDGRLIDIDFGLSRWKKGDPGHVAALEIDDPTWHTQLIEASLQYSSDLDRGAADRAESDVRMDSLLRLSLFLFALTFIIAGIFYLLRLKERRGKAARKSHRLLNRENEGGDYGGL